MRCSTLTLNSTTTPCHISYPVSYPEFTHQAFRCLLSQQSLIANPLVWCCLRLLSVYLSFLSVSDFRHYKRFLHVHTPKTKNTINGSNIISNSKRYATTLLLVFSFHLEFLFRMLIFKNGIVGTIVPIIWSRNA